MLACGVTPTLQQATSTPPAALTEMMTEPSQITSPEELTPTFTPIPVYTVVSLVSNITEETGKISRLHHSGSNAFSFRAAKTLVSQILIMKMKLLTLEEIAAFRDNVAQVQPLPDLTGSFFDQQYELLSPPATW